ncbi:methyltransferase domain-containing protein, partial [candidate division KSB1 bacterium]|nr:methyltransferase domain-containing protein [candidate division KSB1 bacterium]
MGIDFSPAMIEIARSKYSHLEFHLASAEQFKTDEEFDYVILDCLVGTLGDVEYVLQRIASFCKPSTRLILSYHNAL